MKQQGTEIDQSYIHNEESFKHTATFSFRL